jgi:hypothetical protein
MSPSTSNSIRAATGAALAAQFVEHLPRVGADSWITISRSENDV